MKIEVSFQCCKRSKRKLRIVPKLGAFRDAGPVVRTPQYQGSVSRKARLMAQFTLADSQQVEITIKVVDKKGQPAQTDGPPAWLTDNSEVLSLTPSADGLSCTVAAVGPLGTATVSVTADADLGAGKIDLAGSLEIEVTAGQATALTLTPGTPSEQP